MWSNALKYVQSAVRALWDILKDTEQTIFQSFLTGTAEQQSSRALSSERWELCRLHFGDFGNCIAICMRRTHRKLVQNSAKVLAMQSSAGVEDGSAGGGGGVVKWSAYTKPASPGVCK